MMPRPRSAGIVVSEEVDLCIGATDDEAPWVQLNLWDADGEFAVALSPEIARDLAASLVLAADGAEKKSTGSQDAH